jgi:hypothetical protein
MVFLHLAQPLKKLVGGLPDTIVDELDKTNDIFLRPNTYGAGTGINYNPERLKQVWDKMIMGAGIKLFITYLFSRCDKERRDMITCIFWNKSGFYKVESKRVIDASGDADFCYLADYKF